jgi:hypothetical protein
VRTRGTQRLRLVTETSSASDEPTKLIELAADVERAAASLPPEERAAYSEAQQSVVDARRSAEVHEGLLQVR